MGFDRVAVERVTRVAAVFPGQGSHGIGMGGALRDHPVSAALFERADRILGYDLLEIVRDGPEEKLRETRYSQPAIFAVGYALAAVAVADGLNVVASAGHSFAEICSLTLAGALSFDEGLTLVRERGLAMHEAAQKAPGAMSAVLGLDEAAVRRTVAEAGEIGRVQLANFNSPAQIVISGDRDAVARAGELATAAGAKRVVALNVSGAWHSALMDGAATRFAPFVARAEIALPRFTVVSNVDARPYGDVATIRKNLVKSITHEVLWHATAERLVAEHVDSIVEFGGSAVLAPLIKRLPGAPPAVHVGDESGLTKLAASLHARSAAP